MSHRPSLYAILVADAAEALSLSGPFDIGDLFFVQDPPVRGYYQFVPGAVPPGQIAVSGGWLLQAVLGNPYQHVFGGLYTDAGVAAQTFGVAPSKLTSWNGNSHRYLVTDDLAGDQLVIQIPGVYQVTVSVSGTASASRAYHFHPYKNASPIPGAGILRQGSAGITLGGTSVTYETFALGDTISVYGSVDAATGDFTCSEASLSAVLMG